MIREVTTEIRIGELKPVSLNLTFRLAIDMDGVEPLSAEIWTNDGTGPIKVRFEVDAAEMWNALHADEQDALVKEAEEDEPLDRDVHVREQRRIFTRKYGRMG